MVRKMLGGGPARDGAIAQLVLCGMLAACVDGSATPRADATHVAAAVEATVAARLGEAPRTQPPERPAERPRPTATGNPVRLEVLNMSDYVDGRWWDVVGEVRNNGERPVKHVKVVGTFYDGEGKVVGTDTTFAKGADALAPGGVAPFKLSQRHNPAITRYRVQVSGDPA